jgi:hypothetical protein
MTSPLTNQQLDEYAVLAETAAHIGDKVHPRVVTELVDEIRRLQTQRRFLTNQLAKRDAASGDADKKLEEFLTGQANEQQSPTPLTDSRNPAGSHEPLLWNDADGNLLSIHPDTVDDQDLPTVTLQVKDLPGEAFIHVPQAEVPRLAADLCAAAGFRELSEALLIS